MHDSLFWGLSENDGFIQVDVNPGGLTEGKEIHQLAESSSM